MLGRILRFAALTLLLPGLSLACACGCGIFDVGTSSMYASHAGGMASFEFDYLDQSHNRNWGASLELPYWHRMFKTTDPDTGDIVSSTHGAIGDVRVKGVYTGFSADMSTGLTFGLKLASGDHSYANFDPDTQIGSGSTDLLLGAIIRDV